MDISLSERNSDTIKIRTFWVNTTIELKNIKTTSGSNGIWLGVFQLTGVQVLSDVVVFFSSVVVLIPFGQFLGCDTVAFGEWCIVWYELTKIWKDEILDKEI